MDQSSGVYIYIYIWCKICAAMGAQNQNQVKFGLQVLVLHDSIAQKSQVKILGFFFFPFLFYYYFFIQDRISTLS